MGFRRYYKTRHDNGRSMNINHISVSRKKCHDECAQKYKFKYHLKVPPPGPEPFYFIYGKIVHKIAELYVEEKGKRPIGELSKQILRGKIEVDPGVFAPELPDEYQKKFTKHIRAIQNLTDKIGFDGIVEHPFKYDLDPPKERNVVGFIDRLIIKGDKAFIIDYKTTKKGKWRVNNQTVKTDLQLRMYARVVQKEFGLKAQNIQSALFYLEGENIIACKYTSESLKQVEEDLKNAYITIENSDPDKVWGNVGWHCKRCDFNSMCPFYKPQSEKQASWDGTLESLGHEGGWN